MDEIICRMSPLAPGPCIVSRVLPSGHRPRLIPSHTRRFYNQISPVPTTSMTWSSRLLSMNRIMWILCPMQTVTYKNRVTCKCLFIVFHSLWHRNQDHSVHYFQTQNMKTFQRRKQKTQVKTRSTQVQTDLAISCMLTPDECNETGQLFDFPGLPLLVMHKIIMMLNVSSLLSLAATSKEVRVHMSLTRFGRSYVLRRFARSYYLTAF